MREEVLLRRLAGFPRVGFLGLAKNSGKTTSFNFISGVLREGGERLGLLTCGRDGETTDLLYGNPKPPIEVFPGQRLLTTDGEAGRGSADLRRISDTPFHTALGRLLLFDVQRGGRVVLVGPVTVDELAEASQRLLAAGCDRILVDGAVNRRAFARPGVVDGVVVCTGAALARGIDAIVAKTAEALAPYLLPVDDAGETDMSPPAVLEVEGAFTDETADALIRRAFTGTVIVADPSGVFLDPYTLARLETAEILLAVRDRVPILALTANPTAPTGAGVDCEALLARLGEAFPEIPVMDVMACRMCPSPS